MKTTFRAALAGLAASTCMLSSAWAEEIRVGVLLPYSGVFAALAQDIDEAFALGLETFGPAAGVTFEIIREDTEVKPPVGLAKTRKLILQDEVDVLVGVVSSGVLGAIRDTVDGAGVPLIVANAGNDEATGADCSPFITRVSFSNAQVNRPMGQWMVDQGVKKVFTIAPDYAAGRQMIDAFTTAFTAAGGAVVGQEWPAFQKTQDYGPFLANAAASGADAVYVFFAGGEAISFVKQYDSFGLKARMPLYGSGFLTSQLYVGAQGPTAHGVITALHYVPTLDNPENAALVEAFKARTGRIPSEYAVQGYDSARALVEAVRSGATDRAALAAALPRVGFTGPRGELRIDPATNNIVQPIHVYETVAGPDGPTQKVVATLPPEADPANGCVMPAATN